MKNLILLFLLTGTMAYGQGWYPSGARSMSMANASVTLNDVWSHFNNPGAVGKMKQLTIGVSYENRFLLKELQTQSVAAIIPLKTGAISVGGHMFGYEQFRSYKGGVGYGMQLGEKLYAGVQANFQGIQLREVYGSKSTVTGEAGILAELRENWLMGFSVTNLFRAKLSDYQDDRLSTMMRLGTSYRFSDKTIVTAEAEKDLDNAMRFKSGIEYQPLENFFLRGGFATAPVELSFGFGYRIKAFQLDLGSSFHQVLGWSPHFSLIYQAASKK